jgi:hypothetical protein
MDSGDRRLLLWWAVLLALTLLSFESGAQRPEIATALVMVIALVKIRVVILHFMEVADAPWTLRAPLELWLILLGAALLALWHGLFA